MPKPISSRLAAACALAIVLLAVVPVTASAKRVSASLRVVGKGGKVLTEKTLRTGTMSIKTSRGANCFGKGTGGSGRSVKVRGATALGLLAQASRSTPSLRPLLITDAFDFGLGICGVGKSRVSGRASWYLKVNHRGAQVGGDAYGLHGGDEVLWDLAPSFPYPDELVLKAPEAALPGVPFRVRVLSYDEKGKRRPVSGASVTGAAAPTGADGTTTVTLTESSSLRATHGREIPSAASFVCAGVCTGGSQP